MEYGLILGIGLIVIISLLALWGWWDFWAWKQSKQTFSQWVMDGRKWIGWVLATTTLMLGVWLFAHLNLFGVLAKASLPSWPVCVAQPGRDPFMVVSNDGHFVEAIPWYKEKKAWAANNELMAIIPLDTVGWERVKCPKVVHPPKIQFKAPRVFRHKDVNFSK